MKYSKSYVLFTGGGSAGHVTPNLALIERCKTLGWPMAYVGSHTGIEKQILSTTSIPYYSVATGKLRRYFSWQNFKDPFKIIVGILQATLLCWRLKPRVVFSKGGFVAFPVVVGAWINRIPVICHESDLTPGFANRLSFPFARYICVTFAETQKHIKARQKVIVSGTPLRESLFLGSAEKGRVLCGFNADKPIILVTGGGLGADSINHCIRAILPTLLKQFNIIHLCGKNKTDDHYNNIDGYKQFDYVDEEMADFFASADFVISRAGANAIYELIALRKPNLLIPLSKKASRGDQLLNARFCEEKGLSEVLYEEALNEQTLLEKINLLTKTRARYINQLNHYSLPDSIAIIIELLKQC